MPRQPRLATARARSVPNIAARVLLLVLVAVGFGFVASRSDAPEPGTPRGDVASARHAIRALLTPGPNPEALRLLPADFSAVTEVRVGAKTAADGTRRAVHLGGGCSAPWGEDNTRWDFGVACGAHDLGYDLLRYAEEKGHPLGPELRRALDDRLSADMHRICTLNAQNSRALCESVATVYAAGLDVNSWHQRWGPPVGEPIGPLLAGVAVIGSLLSYRLRDRLLIRPRRRATTDPADRRTIFPLPRPTPATGKWTLVGVGSVVVLLCGEVALSLTRWAGVEPGALWPLTWVTQTTVVFFFAAGHANAVNWSMIARAGGGCREFLSHRASWLLRLSLVFAVVAFAVPIALELLLVPQSTIEAVVRLALHPLWLLGLYMLTVVSTPVMLTLHRRAPWITPGVLLASLASLWWLRGTFLPDAASGQGSTAALSGHVFSLLVALFAQQLAFVHRDGVRPGRRGTFAVGALSATLLAIGAVTDLWPESIVGTTGAPPTLAGPPPAVLLAGILHLSVLWALRTRLRALAEKPGITWTAGLASRAPMSLYLVFLTGTLLLVSAVYLPERINSPGGMFGPRAALAVALLVGPAVLVFVWFERHIWHSPPALPVWWPQPTGSQRALSHIATFTGFTFAVLGVFGFALTTLGARNIGMAGLLLDPVQSLVHLLLGTALLHSARTGSTSRPGPWALTALACVPPLLSLASTPAPDRTAFVAHVVVGGFAVVVALSRTVTWLVSANRRSHN